MFKQPPRRDRRRDDVRPVRHAHQDRPDFQSICACFQDVTHARGRVGTGENQDVRLTLDAAAREDPLPQLGIQRGVRVHLTFVLEVSVLTIQNRQSLAHPPTGIDVEIAELAVRAERHQRLHPKAPHVPRRRDHRLGDLLRRWLGVDLRVRDEQRARFQDHQAKRRDGMKISVPKDLTDVVQVPKILPERAANQTVRLLAQDHHRPDRGRVRAHDRARKVRRHAAPRHHLVVGGPVVAIARVALGVDEVEVAPRLDRQSGPFDPRFNDFRASDDDRDVRRLFHHRVCRPQHPLVLALGEDDLARRGRRRLEDRPHDQRRAEH